MKLNQLISPPCSVFEDYMEMKIVFTLESPLTFQTAMAQCSANINITLISVTLQCNTRTPGLHLKNQRFTICDYRKAQIYNPITIVYP